MEEVLHSYYQCGICQEPITYPKKLKCLHVFCHECLVVFITDYFGKASFPCPVCHYKHLPEEPETVITQDTLLILEEDSLMRDVRRFFKNGEELQPIYNADGINRVSCTVHTDSLCGYFCPDCNMLVCVKCRLELHPQCRLRKIDERMRWEADGDIKKVTTDLTDVMSQAETIRTDLNSKVGSIFHNSPERVETIKLYYSDLKEKVVKYLDEQERKVLENAMTLEEKEKAHLANDIGVCNKMATSVESRQSLARFVQERSYTNAAETLVIINHLQKDFEGFKKMLSQLRSDVNTDFNARFIINTELEDKLTDTDIVRIEVIDCCHSDASAVTFEQEGGVEQHANVSSQREQHAQGARPSAPPHDNESLPTYESVVRQSFIQRRRPFRSSVVHHRGRGSASNPALPTSHDPNTPSSNPMPPYHNTQPSHLTTFDQQAYPMPYTQVPPVQPSAPPMSLAAFSHPPDSQYETPPCSLDPIPPGARTITMLKYRSKMDTKTTEDSHLPSLVGIATLGEFFVVVDQKHCCIKRVMYDSTNIVDQYNFERMEPSDVAAVTETLCVVTFPKEGKLLFVNFSHTPGDQGVTVQKTIKSGKYLSIGFCKDTQRLYCGRGPPFSAARVDILSLQGYVTKHINLENSVAVPRYLARAGSKFLALCDVRNQEAMVYDTENIRKAPSILKRYEFHTLKEPQGIASLPLLKSFLVLDGSNGDVYITSHSGYMRKCLSGDVDLERQRNTAIKYSISISLDQRILAVAHNKGTVKFYEIKYM